MSPGVGSSTRVLIAGALCLAILGGMMVAHAWPLWTGTDVRMRATLAPSGDSFRGDHIRFDTPATWLTLASGDVTAPGEVRPVGRWWTSAPEGRERARGAVIYVQLEPRPSGEVEPVTVSRDPVEGQLNLRGRIRHAEAWPQLRVDYGIDVFYVEEGTAERMAAAVRDGGQLQVEIAIAASGRARIRRLNLRSEGDR